MLDLFVPDIADQILIGIDASPSRRVKLYMQFKDGGGAKKKVVARYFGVRPEIPDAWWNRLHLVGFDFGRDSVRETKLYFRHDFATADLLEKYCEKNRVIKELLSECNLNGLNDFIEIMRFGSQKQTGNTCVTELDFGLEPNQIDFLSLLKAGTLNMYLKNGLQELESVCNKHKWFPSRISASVCNEDKFNVYYYIQDRKPSRG